MGHRNLLLFTGSWSKVGCTSAFGWFPHDKEHFVIFYSCDETKFITLWSCELEKKEQKGAVTSHYLSCSYCVTVRNTHTHTYSQTVCVFLEASIDPLADSYRLHPPLWPSRPDSIQIDTQSGLVIRDSTQGTAILMEACVMKSFVQLMECGASPNSLLECLLQSK